MFRAGWKHILPVGSLYYIPFTPYVKEEFPSQIININER